MLFLSLASFKEEKLDRKLNNFVQLSMMYVMSNTGYRKFDRWTGWSIFSNTPNI